MKIVIIGGVAGGATAAARLRRLDEKADIVLFERDTYVSFANCGLPYHIGGVIEHREKLLLQTPAGFKSRYDVDARVLSEVIAIHPDSKSVTEREVKTGRSYVEGYDKLIVSTGASPLKPNIKGVDNERVFTLRNMSDMDRIKATVAREGVDSAVVVGAGFIGLEMAENLKKAGLSVTVIEQLNQVMNTVDYPMAAMVHRNLRSQGVNLLLGETVTAFEPKGDRLRVQTKSQKAIETDIVIMSIGVRPETGLAREAGLTIGCSGGIKVNGYMQTSHPDIYAVGDAVEVTNLVTGKPALIPLAGPANKQARIAADNIVMGNSRTYKGTVGTCIAKLFDISVGAAGATERQLQKEGIEYITSICHGSTHSGYYPGALPISLKINFSPNGKLLGAQAVGFGGVDKRIDLLAQVIRNGGTVQDLQEIEQAYAPPFSSAKAPVNMAGFIAENILQGRVKIIHWHDIDTRDPETVLVDVRTTEEYQAGHIDQSLHIPVDELRGRLGEIPKGKTIYIYCKIGLRGYVATRILMQCGFEAVYNLSGGYDTYACVKEG